MEMIAWPRQCGITDVACVCMRILLKESPGARPGAMAARAVALSTLSRRALAGIPFATRLSGSFQHSAACSTSSSSLTEFRLGWHLAGRKLSCSRTGGGGKMLKVVSSKLDGTDGPVVAEKEVELLAAADSLDPSPVGFTKPSNRSFPEVVVGIKPVDVTEWKGDVLAVGVFEGEVETEEDGTFKHAGLKKLDGFLGGILVDLVKEEEFTGKAGSSTFLRLSGYGFKKIGVVGLGKPDDLKTSTWKGFGEAIAAATKTKATVGAVVLSAKELSENVQIAAAGGIVSGLLLEQYKDTRFKTESKDPPPITLDILGGGDEKAFAKTLLHVTSSANGVVLAKQLVNAPANVLTPGVLAEEAKKVGAAHSDVLTVKVLDQEECTKLKMGAYLGVSAASSNPPAFIHIQYKPQGTIHTKLAIVGKGLTFDSGGYNLKTGAGSMIELMKFDMGGAAAAFGAAKAIASIQPPGVEVNFIVAACENMISGDGMRPGDILTASNGKTIEVNNTDAEGRLTLADALVYACDLGVDKIVDLATLTGACIVALGGSIGGLFTKHDELAEELVAASKVAGEKFWRLPMEESYWEGMKSGIADMVNTGGRPGGSITAALFLSQFVNKDIPWAHLDIAGPVWNDKKGGGTGFAVATLVEWVVKHSS